MLVEVEAGWWDTSVHNAHFGLSPVPWSAQPYQSLCGCAALQAPQAKRMKIFIVGVQLGVARKRMRRERYGAVPWFNPLYKPVQTNVIPAKAGIQGSYDKILCLFSGK